MEKTELLIIDSATAVPPSSEWSGAILRSVRVERGISIETLSKITRIRKGAIELIERDDFVRLPAPIYVRGLISQIARALGLPEEEVSKSYLSRMPVDTGKDVRSRLS